MSGGIRVIVKCSLPWLTEQLLILVDYLKASVRLPAIRLILASANSVSSRLQGSVVTVHSVLVKKYITTEGLFPA